MKIPLEMDVREFRQFIDLLRVPVAWYKELCNNRENVPADHPNRRILAARLTLGLSNSMDEACYDYVEKPTESLTV